MRRLLVYSFAVLLTGVLLMAEEKKPAIRALDVKIQGMVSSRFGEPIVIANEAIAP
jgi:hypothetical protein